MMQYIRGSKGLTLTIEFEKNPQLWVDSSHIKVTKAYTIRKCATYTRHHVNKTQTQKAQPRYSLLGL